MSQPPHLAGAHRGSVRPYREVPGGLWLEDADGQLTSRPCALRIVSETKVYRYSDLARQYLEGRGNGRYLPGQIEVWTNFLMFHQALIRVPTEPGAPHVPLCPEWELTLTDTTGKLNVAIFHMLLLHGAADGQLQHLGSEYDILRKTETPASITHEQWKRIVEEGKSSSLKSLHSQHGSSALIQVLHGLGAEYPE